MKKISVVIPIYYNENNIEPLYKDIKDKLFSHEEYQWEVIMVNDGSNDNSFEVMKQLKKQDNRIKIINLSRNFGSHAAILCGLSNCSGNCAVVKSADLQEPTEIVIDMIKKWEKGNNVVLAVREDRDESKKQSFFANFYYWLVRKTALPNMPKKGFDVYLIDKKVINVLENLDETNSALTGQILWSGFKTGMVYYKRLAREIGRSKWTLKKKIKLVTDTLFSFTTLPIKIVTSLGAISMAVAIIWTIVVLASRITGNIEVTGWTTLFIFQLFSFGIIMLTLGILGAYLWRTFDASRNRPPYIIEDNNIENNKYGE